MTAGVMLAVLAVIGLVFYLDGGDHRMRNPVSAVLAVVVAFASTWLVMQC